MRCLPLGPDLSCLCPLAWRPQGPPLHFPLHSPCVHPVHKILPLSLLISAGSAWSMMPVAYTTPFFWTTHHSFSLIYKCIGTSLYKVIGGEFQWGEHGGCHGALCCCISLKKAKTCLPIA